MSKDPGTHSGKQNTMEGSIFEPMVAQSSLLPSTNDVQIINYLVFLMTVFLLYARYREAMSIGKVQNFFSVSNFNILPKSPVARREPKTDTETHLPSPSTWMAMDERRSRQNVASLSSALVLSQEVCAHVQVLHLVITYETRSTLMLSCL